MRKGTLTSARLFKYAVNGVVATGRSVGTASVSTRRAAAATAAAVPAARSTRRVRAATRGSERFNRVSDEGFAFISASVCLLYAQTMAVNELFRSMNNQLQQRCLDSIEE
jgi:hypothetical protein